MSPSTVFAPTIPGFELNTTNREHGAPVCACGRTRAHARLKRSNAPLSSHLPRHDMPAADTFVPQGAQFNRILRDLHLAPRACMRQSARTQARCERSRVHTCCLSAAAPAVAVPGMDAVAPLASLSMKKRAAGLQGSHVPT